MDKRHRFADRAALASENLSAAERDALRFFQENREEVLVSSAAALAAKIGTSDATIIRTAQALGYSGLDDLRRNLADELRTSLSPAARMTSNLPGISQRRQLSAPIGCRHSLACIGEIEVRHQVQRF